MQCVMCFRFCGCPYVCTQWPGIGDGNRACAQRDFCLVVFAQKSSSQEYFGDLIVKVGYRRQTEGTVSIFVNG